MTKQTIRKAGYTPPRSKKGGGYGRYIGGGSTGPAAKSHLDIYITGRGGSNPRKPRRSPKSPYFVGTGGTRPKTPSHRTGRKAAPHYFGGTGRAPRHGGVLR